MATSKTLALGTRMEPKSSSPTRTPSGRDLWETRAPQASESNWTLKLKQIADTAADTLHAQVHSARLVQVYGALDRDAARFELETDQGPVQAILSRSGEYSFFWKR